jgi:hypothetical protein
MKRLLVLPVALLIAGCNKAASTAENPTPPAAPITSPSAQAGGGSSAGSVAPIGSPMAGGITPMAGTDSVEGSGMGGIGQSAKNAARKAAGAESAPAGTSETGE